LHIMLVSAHLKVCNFTSAGAPILKLKRYAAFSFSGFNTDKSVKLGLWFL